MPKLSPQAQAVVDAYWATPNEPITTKGRLPRVAAALRAVVDQADPKRHVEDISYQHQLYVDGWKDCLEVILAIAAELKAHD